MTFFGLNLHDSASLNNCLSRVSTVPHLSSNGQAAGLDLFIITNPSQGNNPPSPGMIAITVEALLGAVWYDTGRNMQEVRDVMSRLGLV
jgi:ribonuclease-3